MNRPKVAIVHDWLTNLGGAERTVLSILNAFPDADLYTSVYDDKGIDLFRGYRVHTTWLQKIPGRLKYKHQLWSVLRPLAFRSLRLDDYDIVITSSSAESKHARTKNGVNICYCHTPIRYYWVNPEKYMKDPGLGPLNWLAPFALKLLLPLLKRSDYRAAQKVDLFIANSKAVKKRIKEFYGQESTVLYPPVRVGSFKPSKKRASYFVTAGRQVAYKRHDLAVSACSELGLELLVLGSGPENEKLKNSAGPTITFNSSASDEDIIRAFSESIGFIHPGEEDFGITPIEAMAGGTPVIAYKAGGALDYVEPGKTGEFFDAQTSASLQKILADFTVKNYSPGRITKHAQKFSEAEFAKKLKKLVEKKAAGSLESES
ncbi:MAG: glycosyltransferase [Patescibacteria group bacterium]